MLQNHHLAQAIGDVGFYEFKRQLLYKAAWYGARVILPIAGSRPASGVVAAVVDADLTLSDGLSLWQCGLVLDRDLNAPSISTTGRSSSDSKACGATSTGRAQTSRETGGREAGTKHQVWLVHIWVSLELLSDTARRIAQLLPVSPRSRCLRCSHRRGSASHGHGRGHAALSRSPRRSAR